MDFAERRQRTLAILAGLDRLAEEAMRLDLRETAHIIGVAALSLERHAVSPERGKREPVRLDRKTP